MYTRTFWDFLYSSAGKESACNAGDTGDRGYHPWVGTVPWRRKWQPIPVFLPEKSHGQRKLVGYSSKGRGKAHKESFRILSGTH